MLVLYQSIGPTARPFAVFRKLLRFYREELLAPRPKPKLKDNLLSAVHYCVFNILAVTLHIWRPFVPPQPEAAQYCVHRDPLITDLNHIY
jgi:hypothetical protein